MNIDELALKVGAEIWPDTVRNTEECARFARIIIAEYEKVAGSEPVAKRFNCWSANEGDSWYEHPADAQLLGDVLGNAPKVGDEFEVMAGWHCVQAKYKIISQDGDDFEVECLSHPFDTEPARADQRAADLEAQVAELRAEVISLTKERDKFQRRAIEYKADAERYRYMRSHALFQERNGPGLYWYLSRYDRELPLPERIDEAIDAALAATKEVK